MPTYQALLMVKVSTTILRSHNFIAPDATDASDALERAVRHVDGRDVELWEGETLIKRFYDHEPNMKPLKRRRPWSEQDDIELRKALAEGISLQRLMVRMRRAETTIRRRAKALGLTVPPRSAGGAWKTDLTR